MAYQVRQLNKKTGVTYVYEAVSVWDKDLKQARNKQVCVGKIDPVTGTFIPSKRLDPNQSAVRDPVVTASAQVVGPTFVLDAIAERIGLRSIMKSVYRGFSTALFCVVWHLQYIMPPINALTYFFDSCYCCCVLLYTVKSTV